jgi:hypothetical protein
MTAWTLTGSAIYAPGVENAVTTVCPSDADF